MARLLYMAIMSLDGYVAEEAGSYDWAMPDDEVFGFVNDFERQRRDPPSLPRRELSAPPPAAAHRRR